MLKWNVYTLSKFPLNFQSVFFSLDNFWRIHKIYNLFICFSFSFYLCFLFSFLCPNLYAFLFWLYKSFVTFTKPVQLGYNFLLIVPFICWHRSKYLDLKKRSIIYAFCLWLQWFMYMKTIPLQFTQLAGSWNIVYTNLSTLLIFSASDITWARNA